MLTRLMPDVVWTTLITGATGVLSGGIGWLTARQQTKIELQKLKQERDPGTAEDLKFRQALYLKYVEQADAVFRVVVKETSMTDWYGAVKTFRQLDDQMELFADEAVLPSRAEMWTLLEEMVRGIRSESRRRLEEDHTEATASLAAVAAAVQHPGDDHEKVDVDQEAEEIFAELLRGGLEPRRQRFLAARAKLVTAIRSDVGPRPRGRP